MTQDHLRALLALWRVPGIGPRRFYALTQAFSDNVSAIFKAPTAQLKALNLSDEIITLLRTPDWAGAEKELHWALQPGNSLLTWQDKAYPETLRHHSDAPPLLFVKGNPALLKTPQIALVGSRHPTPTGKEVATQFAFQLARAGYTVTSGLALGIDAASHRGALQAKGSTIAVLGTGIDAIYPACHVSLAKEIIQQGALVSEFPLGEKACAQHFPQRNRIISGLSSGVVVVEAAKKSGSLITARFALEQSKEVFAVPGSIYNPLSRGCHALIRQGAKLVETVEDILEELKNVHYTYSLEDKIPLHQSSRSSYEREDYRILSEAMDFSPRSIDTLVESTGLTAAAVSSMLLVLECDGIVTATPAGYMKNAEKRG